MKTYLNKDLHNISYEDLSEQTTIDFIGDDFIDQMEWAMLMIQMKFQQVSMGSHLKRVSISHFDKSYLLSSDGLNNTQNFFKPFDGLQPDPSMFPHLNVKVMQVTEVVQLMKCRELDAKSKRGLDCNKRHVYEVTSAFFNKETESFYGMREGYCLNPGFFNIGNESYQMKRGDIVEELSLDPNYTVSSQMDDESTADVSTKIAMMYQLAMSMYYEWSIYIKEYDNIGLIIPINPMILSEIFKTSMMKFDSRKRMLHFVRDHYRRKVALPNEDYSVYVRRYLRGEHKFNYNGFSAEIIPPRYDLNRVKTRKKFIKPEQDD
jgi:hypothetical protein